MIKELESEKVAVASGWWKKGFNVFFEGADGLGLMGRWEGGNGSRESIGNIRSKEGNK